MRSALRLLAAIALLLPLASCHHGGREGEQEYDPRRDSIPAMGFWVEDFVKVDGTVDPGETFTGLLGRLGMPSDDVQRLIGATDEIFDVRKMRADNAYEAYYTDSLRTSLRYFRYIDDKVSSTLFSCADSLYGWRYSKPVVHEERYTDVSISSSLWNDMSAAGSSPLVILKLSDVYAWSVDFFGLQEGDRFRVIYDQDVCEGDVIAVDTIKFAVFSRGDKDIYAVRFDQGDGGNVYWNDKGESLRKAFLKAPLEFKRISSGFSYHRRHPVTGKVKPHTAVDYAAPAGTPVVALGDGTVLSAGWSKGGGNTLRLRHIGGYETGYLHLSRFAKGVKAGAKVRQGQVIGYVGSTGVSTGPHLDFRVWKNGTPINPLSLESPSAEPLRSSNKAAFDSVFVEYKQLMDSLSCR